jgi:hypothetical protein
MGTREYQRGYSHGLTSRFPMCHRHGRPYINTKAFASYYRGYQAGAEVRRQQQRTRLEAQANAASEPMGTDYPYLTAR